MAERTALFFDLDGTLVRFDDSKFEGKLEVDWLSSNGVRNAASVLGSQVWRSGKGRRELLGMTQAEYERLFVSFAEVEYRTKKECLEDGRLRVADGAFELLESSPWPMALVSNSCKEWVRLALRELKLRKHFKFVFEREYCFDDLRKPSCEVAVRAAKALGVEADRRVWMLGDSPKDAEFSRNAGLTSVSVFNDIGADYHCRDFHEAKRLVLG
jgi:beta-phosphoglucomutase-like phosphatase (HAD superfamily)